jgi:hypothetical protein
MRRFTVVLFAVFALTASGGCIAAPKKNYPPLDQISRIEIHTGSNHIDQKPVRAINDPGEVTRIVEYVNGHCSGWGGTSDMFGVPVPQVEAYFYAGDRFEGHFGVGPGFFETQRAGDFSSKTIEVKDEQEFLALIGLPDYDLRGER